MFNYSWLVVILKRSPFMYTTKMSSMPFYISDIVEIKINKPKQAFASSHHSELYTLVKIPFFFLRFWWYTIFVNAYELVLLVLQKFNIEVSAENMLDWWYDSLYKTYIIVNKNKLLYYTDLKSKKGFIFKRVHIHTLSDSLTVIINTIFLARKE